MPDGIAPAAAVPSSPATTPQHRESSPTGLSLSQSPELGACPGPRQRAAVSSWGQRRDTGPSSAPHSPASSQPLCVSEPRLLPLRAQMPGPCGLAQAALPGEERALLCPSLRAQPSSCFIFHVLLKGVLVCRHYGLSLISSTNKIIFNLAKKNLSSESCCLEARCWFA